MKITKRQLREMIVEMARRRRPGISQWVAASKLYNNVRDIQYGTARVIKQVGDEWLVTYLTASGDPRDVFVGGHEDRDGSVSLHVRLARRE